MDLFLCLHVSAIAFLSTSTACRNFRLAAGLLFLCLGGSWLLSIYFSLHYRYTYKVADPFESFDILYDKPWQRIGPYIVGEFAVQLRSPDLLHPMTS